MGGMVFSCGAPDRSNEHRRQEQELSVDEKLVVHVVYTMEGRSFPSQYCREYADLAFTSLVSGEPMRTVVSETGGMIRLLLIRS